MMTVYNFFAEYLTSIVRDYLNKVPKLAVLNGETIRSLFTNGLICASERTKLIVMSDISWLIVHEGAECADEVKIMIGDETIRGERTFCMLVYIVLQQWEDGTKLECDISDGKEEQVAKDFDGCTTSEVTVNDFMPYVRVTPYGVEFLKGFFNNNGGNEE